MGHPTKNMSKSVKISEKSEKKVKKVKKWKKVPKSPKKALKKTLKKLHNAGYRPKKGQKRAFLGIFGFRGQKKWKFLVPLPRLTEGVPKNCQKRPFFGFRDFRHFWSTGAYMKKGLPGGFPCFCHLFSQKTPKMSLFWPKMTKMAAFCPCQALLWAFLTCFLRPKRAFFDPFLTFFGPQKVWFFRGWEKVVKKGVFGVVFEGTKTFGLSGPSLTSERCAKSKGTSMSRKKRIF